MGSATDWRMVIIATPLQTQQLYRPQDLEYQLVNQFCQGHPHLATAETTTAQSTTQGVYDKP